MSKEYGKSISPILEEIADALWEIDAREMAQPYEYSENAFRASLKIMMSVAMDRLWDNQEKFETPKEDRLLQAEKLGNDFRKLFKENLNVDTTKMWRKK
jgi:hypothetical protein